MDLRLQVVNSSIITFACTFLTSIVMRSSFSVIYKNNMLVINNPHNVLMDSLFIIPVENYISYSCSQL